MLRAQSTTAFIIWHNLLYLLTVSLWCAWQWANRLILTADTLSSEYPHIQNSLNHCFQ
jgi:hypothetical protein